LTGETTDKKKVGVLYIAKKGLFKLLKTDVWFRHWYWVCTNLGSGIWG